MVVLGAYVAFGTFVSPIGPDPNWTLLWLAQGVTAVGTAVAGVLMLQERPRAATIGVVMIAAWLLVSAGLAATVGVSNFANPFTIGTTVFLVIALLTLLRS